MSLFKLSVRPYHDSYYLALVLSTLCSSFSDILDWKCSETLHPPVWQACSLYTAIQRRVCRLFCPACGSLSVDVGKAGEMLRVFVLWVPARAQGRVHVPRSGIAGWMHRWAGVTAVSWRHIWPPGGDGCRVQPRCAAHQARLHSRHLAVELVLWKRRRGNKFCYLLREAYSEQIEPQLTIIFITNSAHLWW